ncbi:MAG: MFS transporter [Alphaproteobacteria bacterium]|nr:MFS transporter [Alphaproteobacteria bacterium]
MSLTPSIGVFRYPAYARYWVMRQLMSSSRQMTTVAIGWQAYDIARRTRTVEESALILGFIGLTMFAPVLILSLVGGQAADRFDRKLILLVTHILKASTLAMLSLYAVGMGDPPLWILFVAAGMLGCINAFMPAASNALYPTLVPREMLPNAIGWNSLGFQTSAIAGPAIGGFLYLAGAATVYGVGAIMTAIAAVIILTMKTPKHIAPKDARGIAMMLEGLRYVRDNKLVLGAISLDLVVVFFGGATALLPVFARDILHVGASGLGFLRAAPAAGALIVAVSLATAPLKRRVGKWMFGAIAVYGLAMLGFGLSNAFALSMVALAIAGGADMISVYVRQSLIQLSTPDFMKGRVASVSFIFISASNELGEFESGVAARFLGPVGAVLLGGAAALTTAAAWTRIFPSLWRADAIEDTDEIYTSRPDRTRPVGAIPVDAKQLDANEPSVVAKP